MSITVKASDGRDLPTCSLAMTFGYSGSNLVTATVDYPYQGVAQLYVQTFTYAGTDIINVSEWVAQ